MNMQRINLEGLSTKTLEAVEQDLKSRLAVAQQSRMQDKQTSYLLQLNRVRSEMLSRRPAHERPDMVIDLERW